MLLTEVAKQLVPIVAATIQQYDQLPEEQRRTIAVACGTPGDPENARLIRQTFFEISLKLMV